MLVEAARRIVNLSEMRPTQQFSREAIGVEVLLVPGRDQATLQRVLSHSAWHVRSVDSLDEAVTSLKDGCASVVVVPFQDAAGAFPWRYLQEQTEAVEPKPRLVVTTHRLDDSIRAEVLAFHVSDLLELPCDTREVFQVIARAWRSWRTELVTVSSWVNPK